MPKEFSFDGDQLDPNQIPRPATWKIVIAPIKVEDTTDGGIILTHETQNLQESVRFVGRVLAMGPLCFKQDRFKPHPDAPPIPTCKVGDVIITGQYSGIKVPCKIQGQEPFDLRIVNDDEIVGIIEDLSVLNV